MPNVGVASPQPSAMLVSSQIHAAPLSLQSLTTPISSPALTASAFPQPPIGLVSLQSLATPVSSHSTTVPSIQSPIAPVSLQSSTAPKLDTRRKQKLFPTSAPTAQQTWPSFFPQNVDVPSSLIVLPAPGASFKTTAQLTSAIDLLRTSLSPALAAASVTASFNPSQQLWMDALRQGSGIAEYDPMANN